MLRQNAEYSRNPHDDTARCRHLPMVPVARAARNTASSSWVSAYAASPATRSTSGIPPHAPATAACTAPALLAGAPVRPCEASARRKAPQQPVRRILEATGLIDVFSANPSMGQAASSARHAGHGHRRRRDGPVPPWLPDLAAGGRHAAARHSLDEPGMCRPGHIAREACVKRRSSRERLRPDRSQLIRWFSRQAGIVVAVTVA